MAKRGRKPKSTLPVAERKAFVIHRANVRAGYDAAQTTNHNKKHWARSNALSADGEASAAVRTELRNRAREECRNNSYARGIVLTLANDIVGTGPRLQMLSDNAEINSAIEAAFYQWCRDTAFFEKLRTMRMARVQDGEAFGMLVSNPNSPNAVKLDIQLLEAEQVASETAKPATNDVDGILLDAFGNPTQYTVMKNHPGDGTGGKAQFMKVPASAMLHSFRVDRPGQHRGVPEIVPALELFAQLRRWTAAVLAAAETAADFAAVMYTQNPADGVAAASEDPFGSIELDRNMMMSLPEGWQMSQFKAEQPQTTYADFKREILNEIARCLNMPYNVAACNSSGYNYSSATMDHEVYQKSIRVEQTTDEYKILDRVFGMWLAEYALLPEAPAIDALVIPPHKWYWDGVRKLDPIKAATAQQMRLANNTSTFADECAADGKDWEDVFEQRARENERMRELGLTAPDITPDATQDEPAAQEDTSDEEQV